MNQSDKPEIKLNEPISQFEERALKQVEEALLDHDILRAAAIITEYKGLIDNLSPAFFELEKRIEAAAERLRTVERLYSEGKRALEHDDPEHAIDCFHDVLKLCPDHAEARAGLQGASRYSDWRNTIINALDRSHDARCRGDFETARERCAEVLSLAPDHEAAAGFLDEINHWIALRRKAFRTINEGQRLFDQGNYKDAIEVWDGIGFIDSSFNEGKHLIEEAERAIRIQESEDLAADKLKAAYRAIVNQRYAQALEFLQDFPEDSPLNIDARVYRKKALDGVEKIRLTTELKEKVFLLVDEGNIEKAKLFYEILLDLDPRSPVIDEVRDVINQ